MSEISLTPFPVGLVTVRISYLGFELKGYSLIGIFLSQFINLPERFGERLEPWFPS